MGWASVCVEKHGGRKEKKTRKRCPHPLHSGYVFYMWPIDVQAKQLLDSLVTFFMKDVNLWMENNFKMRSNSRSTCACLSVCLPVCLSACLSQISTLV